MLDRFSPADDPWPPGAAHSLVLDQVQVVSDGHLAHVAAKASFVTKNNDGSEERSPCRWTLGLIKRGDTWRIFNEHLTPYVTELDAARAERKVGELKKPGMMKKPGVRLFGAGSLGRPAEKNRERMQVFENQIGGDRPSSDDSLSGSKPGKSTNRSTPLNSGDKPPGGETLRAKEVLTLKPDLKSDFPSLYRTLDEAGNRDSQAKVNDVLQRLSSNRIETIAKEFSDIFAKDKDKVLGSDMFSNVAAEVLSRKRKAFYGNLYVFRPQTYQRIYTISRGCCGVREAGGMQPECSGVLVARDLVLTASHCTEDFQPHELEICFNFEQDLGNVELPVSVYPVVEYVARGAKQTQGKLDFTLIRVGAEPTECSREIAGRCKPSRLVGCGSMTHST